MHVLSAILVQNSYDLAIGRFVYFIKALNSVNLNFYNSKQICEIQQNRVYIHYQLLASQQIKHRYLKVNHIID